MNNILITGGAGFIGSAITINLIKKGYNIRILDNESRGALRRLESIKGEYECIKGDIRDTNITDKACTNIDTIIHLAYINGTKFFYSKPELVLDVAINGTTNIMKSAIKHKCKEFYYASSSEVYNNPPVIPTPENIPLVVPDPYNPRFTYGGGKIMGELMTIYFAGKHFEKSIIFRPHNVYGPDMGWEHVIPESIMKMKKIISYKKNRLEYPIQGDGTQTRSFIYIDDFISGLNLIMHKGEHLETYNIGTANEIKVKDLVLIIAEYYKKDIHIIPGTKVSGSPDHRCPDISKLMKLGFKPKISLQEGLKQTIKWYDNNKHFAPKTIDNKVVSTL